VVANPFGLTVPRRIASVAVIFVADPVVALGGVPFAVVNVWS
jgi:hypothetical protein